MCDKEQKTNFFFIDDMFTDLSFLMNNVEDCWERKE